jgi:primosomal protein N' (replication factor Y)
VADSIFEVAVNAPLPNTLTYKGDLDLSDHPPEIGDSVRVPLGRRQSDGVILARTRETGKYKLKSIANVNMERPRLPDRYLQWIRWLSSYYLFPIGQIANLAFPPLERKEKLRKSKRSAIIPEMTPDKMPVLSQEQERCIQGISAQTGFAAHLLFGVTGSGKTEVYLQLLSQVIARGQQGLVLVPEISLTPQLVQRFSQRFGQNIAVLHSHLTEREKTTQWWNMVNGQTQILIGARSALFCPIDNIGLIIVDEEHEPSFKQDEKLKYHGRDAAVMRAKLADCPIVLGSATPSLESWYNVQQGKYQLHTMNRRVSDRELPQFHVVDLRVEREAAKASENKERPFWLTSLLHNKMVETLDRGEQVALFLNRRGIAQTVLCQECGVTRECPNCAVTLTLHGRSHLVCHYCDFHETLAEICPACRQGELVALGLGTELIEQDIQNLFPDKILARADRDEIQSRETLEELIRRIEQREIDILIGTQMIAKGLDFPGLTFVGLVLADVGFNLPDFRSSERSFQLLTQVGGRSGRHLNGTSGQVVIQTYNPNHPSVVFAQQADFRGFAERELAFREELGYPPFGRLVSVRIQGTHLLRVQKAAEDLGHRATQLLEQVSKYQPIEILGPVEAPLSKLRGKFRYHILFKGSDPNRINHFCQHLLRDSSWVPSGVRLLVDVDPIQLL